MFEVTLRYLVDEQPTQSLITEFRGKMGVKGNIQFIFKLVCPWCGKTPLSSAVTYHGHEYHKTCYKKQLDREVKNNED